MVGGGWRCLVVGGEWGVALFGSGPSCPTVRVTTCANDEATRLTATHPPHRHHSPSHIRPSSRNGETDVLGHLLCPGSVTRWIASRSGQQ